MAAFEFSRTPAKRQRKQYVVSTFYNWAAPLVALFSLYSSQSILAFVYSSGPIARSSFSKRAAYFQPTILSSPLSPFCWYNNRRNFKTTTMCICINCARVTDCAAYHFVETKHNQPHMKENPTFTPRNGSPTVEVHIRPLPSGSVFDDLVMDHNKAHDSFGNKINGGEADGSAVSYKPQSAVEYDVIRCEDFVDAPGTWVQNMPDEIRRMNPNFVPT
mmetsp:Transcript_25430/g.58676  ORF Transcript_25430/g.58676 Transcript_25430/m.58676 type:complete len:217 (-) Transcript_25430:288-938(-)